jgi:hypothetical protein
VPNHAAAVADDGVAQVLERVFADAARRTG